MENTKFRDIKDFTQLSELVLKLRALNMLVKCENMTQLQEVNLSKYIATNFKDLTALDVYKAVNLYISDQIECEAKYCVKMSGEYFGVILSAYRKWKRENVPTVKPIAEIEEAKEETAEERYKLIDAHYQKHQKLPDWGENIYLSAYEYMVEEVYSPTVEEKKKFAEKVRAEKINQQEDLKQLGYSQQVRAKINEITNLISRPSHFANHCRVLYIKNHIKTK